MMFNNKLFLFLKNSYVLKLNIDGDLRKVEKLPAKLSTNPISIDNQIIYLDYSNKLSVID